MEELFQVVYNITVIIIFLRLLAIMVYPTPIFVLYYFSKIYLILVRSWENFPIKSMLTAKCLITVFKKKKDLIAVYKGQNPIKGNITCYLLSL